MDHRRSESYVYGQSLDTTTAHHTSSAFSASAQPDEDWTKISDLAERRRIQNRIAQRNYRKKLKRRLEDLERKAASTSPSPEQEARQLPVKPSKPKACSAPQKKRVASPQRQPSASPSVQQTAVADEWSMFQGMHSRQTTTSPPPFLYSSVDSSQTPPSPQLPGAIFPAMTDSFYQFPRPMDDMSTQYMWQDKSFATKLENPLDNDMAPLYLSSLDPAYSNAVDLTFPPAFQDQCLTPELCDLYDYSSAGSPSDFGTFPQTPMMVPLTPPYHSFEPFEQS